MGLNITLSTHYGIDATYFNIGNVTWRKPYNLNIALFGFANKDARIAGAAPLAQKNLDIEYTLGEEVDLALNALYARVKLVPEWAAATDDL